ncbi:hypothetical protein RUM44_007360 [Polyplax serrata]|uniref:RING-type E3 ubiquitin transferase n=1 Tax=Polyplax serrata TaxID=468196 RepID=A0ABR1B0G4_POLSC
MLATIKRISNWIRSVKKANKLIDANLWEKIKEQYKEQVRLKLAGEDDGLNEFIQNQNDVQVPLSKSGEVAQEFSKLLQDYTIEQQKRNQAEELASRELIEKLRLEEEAKLEQIKEKKLKTIKQDEKLARMLQEGLEKEGLEADTQTLSCNERKSTKGPMDSFLKECTSVQHLSKHESSETVPKVETESFESNEKDTSSESTDSFSLELNFFKPIKKVLRTPPKRYPDGRIQEINLTRVTPKKLPFVDSTKSSLELGATEGKRIHSSNSAFVDANCYTKPSTEEVESSPKRLKFSQDEPDMGILKDITMGENNDSNSASVPQNDACKKKTVKHMQDNYVTKYINARHENGENDSFETQDYLCPSPTIEDKLIEEQRRIEQIILQERKDRELAIKLSQEWESETIRKPQTRSMQADSVKNKRNGFKNIKNQKTLVESGIFSKRTRAK